MRALRNRPWRTGAVLAVASALAAAWSLSGAAEVAPPTADELARTAEALRERAGTSDLAYQLVSSLSVEVGPRLAGSPGDARAVQWALAKLRELGFEQVRSEPVTVPHWERGEGSGEIVAPYPQPVVLAALGGSVATPPAGIEAEVLYVDSLDALRALPEGGAAGKIVFIDGRMEPTRDASGYGRAVAKRGAGPSEASKKGAVALLIRSAGTSDNRIAHTGATREQEGVRRIPAAALSNPDADLVAAQAKSGKTVRFRLRLTTRVLPDAQSANVIGEIRGREKPEEIVLLGAHLDSWDLGQGALDDGAGCAIVMATAKLIAELPVRPRRTVRVVLFANEEFGLSGARAYAAAHEAELARHVAAVEADLGSGALWSFTSGVEEAALPAVETVARLLAPLGIARGNNDGQGGADLSPMTAARVPLFGLWQDTTLYFDVHHTVNDTLAQVDQAGLQQNVAAHAVFAYAAAEMEPGFGRARAPKDGQ